MITDATRPGYPIVWVNEAFVRTTGYPVEEVLGRSPNLLQGARTDMDQARRLGRAVSEGRAETVTLLNYRRDGQPFWNQVSVSPVVDATGVCTHCVGIQVDVTERIAQAAKEKHAMDVERRAVSALALVSRVSDLLFDLDDPYVLHEIASLLRAEVVSWAGFFLADRDLFVTDGPEAPLHVSAFPGRRRRAPGPTGTRDPVQGLLDGVVGTPLEVRLDGEPADGATAWLVDRLRSELSGQLAESGSVVAHLVQGRRRNFGVLVTVPRSGVGLDGLDGSDRLVLDLVVRRVGLSLENVRLYAREHRLAETLQRAMLPAQVEVRDLDVWTYYAPSSGHAQVGGDWYDVLEVSPDVVALVIGDVVGHDIEAAAAMGQLRSVVRSYAFEDQDPAAVLERVDQMVAGVRIPRYASLVLAMLVRGDPWTLTYSRAGHLPPLVIRAGEVIRLTGGAGGLIGLTAGARSAATLELQPGDVLVLYTDGLIERRTQDLRDGLDALAEVCGRIATGDAAGVGEELLAELGDAPEDDVAVVVVRVPDAGEQRGATGATPRRRRWSLPSEPASISRARRAVVRTCEAWEIPGVSNAELVVSELVANAVMHGWGHVVLRLFDTGDGLRIEVEDANPAPPTAADGQPGGIGGFGMRIVERLADWGWRPSGDGKLVWARLRPS